MKRWMHHGPQKPWVSWYSTTNISNNVPLLCFLVWGYAPRDSMLTLLRLGGTEFALCIAGGYIHWLQKAPIVLRTTLGYLVIYGRDVFGIICDGSKCIDALVRGTYGQGWTMKLGARDIRQCSKMLAVVLSFWESHQHCQISKFLGMLLCLLFVFNKQCRAILFSTWLSASMVQRGTGCSVIDCSSVSLLPAFGPLSSWLWRIKVPLKTIIITNSPFRFVSWCSKVQGSR